MAYPIQNLTKKEQIVLTEIAGQCRDDYCAWVRDIVKNTGLGAATVKGVISSLDKKNHIYLEERDRFHDIFIFIEKVPVCYDDEAGELSGEGRELFEAIADFKQ